MNWVPSCFKSFHFSAPVSGTSVRISLFCRKPLSTLQAHCERHSVWSIIHFPPGKMSHARLCTPVHWTRCVWTHRTDLCVTKVERALHLGCFCRSTLLWGLVPGKSHAKCFWVCPSWVRLNWIELKCVQVYRIAGDRYASEVSCFLFFFQMSEGRFNWNNYFRFRHHK